MASISSSHHARSASYPPKTNPILLKIEQQLSKLRESESSSTSPMQTICIGLSGLAGLYRCINEALNYIPVLQQEQSKTQMENLVNGSSKLLEVCSSMKEMVGNIREAIFRDVARYFSVRKEIVKRSKELALRLTQAEAEFMSQNRGLSQDESEMTRVVRCVGIINISVMESLAQILSSKLAKSRRFSVLSKMLGGKGKEGMIFNDVDVALHGLASKEGNQGEKMVAAQKRLEGLDAGLAEIQKGLSCVSSQLAKTKASLLKVVSF